MSGPRDTSPDVQRMLDEHALAMTPAQKLEAVRDAWRTARALALAGLRIDHPGASEAELEDLWAERRLGTELYRRVVEWRRGRGLGTEKRSKRRSSS